MWALESISTAWKWRKQIRCRAPAPDLLNQQLREWSPAVCFQAPLGTLMQLKGTPACRQCLHAMGAHKSHLESLYSNPRTLATLQTNGSIAFYVNEGKRRPQHFLEAFLGTPAAARMSNTPLWRCPHSPHREWRAQKSTDGET